MKQPELIDKRLPHTRKAEVEAFIDPLPRERALDRNVAKFTGPILFLAQDPSSRADVQSL